MIDTDQLRIQFSDILKDTLIYSNPLTDGDKEKLAKIGDLITPNTPKQLFRYRAYSKRSYRAFRDNQIWLSAPYKFNDPYDCIMKVDIDKLLYDAEYYLSSKGQNEILNFIHKNNKLPISSIDEKDIQLMQFIKEVKNNNFSYEKMNINDLSEQTPFILKQLKNRIIDIINQTTHYPKIASFSEKPNSMLMWSHYANSHNGFVLSYDFSELTMSNFTSLKDTAINLFPAIYSPERYDGTQFVEDTICGELFNSTGIKYKSRYDRLIWFKSNLYKSLNWDYEKEWRIIYTDEKMKGNFGKIPLKIVPTAIYYGVNLGAKQQEKLSKIAKSLHVDEYKMKIDYQSGKYTLESYPID